MATKRVLEFQDYSDMTDEVACADVHGIVTHLSPVKKSKKGNNYFHGQMCDGKNNMRFVGFASNHQKILQDFLEKKEPIQVHNCQIKKSNRDSDKLELLVKGATKISPSPKKFDVSRVEYQHTEAVDITLNKVQGTEARTIINVDVKVITCQEPVTLGTRQKQEVKVCDSTGWGVVQLWEENIGILKQGCCYKLKQFRVTEYESTKSISMCWEGSEAQPIKEIKNTVAPPDDSTVPEPKSITILKPHIAAVYKLETFYKCLRCGSRTEPVSSNEVRCCNKECGILNNSTYCDIFSSAEILVVHDGQKFVLSAFGDMIKELLGNNITPSEEALIQSPPILELKCQNNEIVKVVRQ